MYKRLKKWLLFGSLSSVLFTSGGIIGSIASVGLSLVGISTVALLIQGFMKHKDLDVKIKM